MITTTPFGTALSGSPVTVYNLVCAGARVRVMDYGATILGIEVPDASGDVADIVLGFDALDGYFDNPACYGGTIGPSANRTDKGQIEIAGTVYQMACNDGPDKANNLHTDLVRGLHKRVWNATVDEITNTVSFTCELKDGELGLPGNRTFTVAYVLQAGPTGAAELTCTQSCVTDADTFVNMTNHTYFNLAGHDAGTVLDQIATIDAEAFLPQRQDNVSSGEFAPWPARHSISAHPRRSAATSRRTTSSSRLHGALTIVSAWMALPPMPTRATHCACKIKLAPHARHLRNRTGRASVYRQLAQRYRRQRRLQLRSSRRRRI